MSVLFCDSNCELWFDEVERLGLKFISMPYTLEDTEYFYDLGKNTDFDFWYKSVRNGAKCITSALNPEMYDEIFRPYFEKGEDIFYITFSHALSGTFQSLDAAVKKLKEEFPDRKFTVFNTKEISLGAGLQVKYAAELWRTGASDGELFKFLNEFTNRVATYFACDDLMYLHKGGRLSLTSGICGTILGIKPVLTFNEEGGLSVVYKVRGRKRTIRNLARRVVEDGVELDKYEVYVVDADCGEDGDLLARLIKEGRPEAEVKRQIVGPVIASHCGPGTLGVIFVAKERPIKLSVPEQEFNS